MGRARARPRHRAGSGDERGADPRLDEPRVARQNGGDRRGALLVALAHATVEEGRAVRQRPDGARDPSGLRRGRGPAQGRAEWGRRLSHGTPQLLLPETGERALGDGGAGDQGSQGDVRAMSDILERLADVVESRKSGDPEKSYVSRLFARGPDAILKKVGEEATETVMAAKDGDRLRIVGETADLWFHCLIMLAQFGLRPGDVLAELRRREGISGIDEKAARADKQRAKAERK